MYMYVAVLSCHLVCFTSSGMQAGSGTAGWRKALEFFAFIFVFQLGSADIPAGFFC